MSSVIHDTRFVRVQRVGCSDVACPSCEDHWRSPELPWKWFCSCGEVGWAATDDEARALAYAHRSKGCA